MKIFEAIKFIVDKNDKKLLTDSNRFKSYLLDLCSDNSKDVNYSATSSRASCFNDSGYYHISYYYEQLSPRLHKLME